jgi:hypothetical protein
VTSEVETVLWHIEYNILNLGRNKILLLTKDFGYDRIGLLIIRISVDFGIDDNSVSSLVLTLVA